MKKNLVFYISLAVSLGVIAFGALDNGSLAELSGRMMLFVNDHFGWLYLLSLPLMFVFLVYLACSRYGNLKLGPPGVKPEYGTLSWFAMLFCAGTGIGLVFWSVAEPLTHYAAPPNGLQPCSIEAARFSIRTCFLHWGILPWACFAVVGLGIAYFQFCKKSNGLISNLLQPLVGERMVTGYIGKVVDIFAILVSVAGVATSLGLGSMQICGGLNYLFDIPNGKVAAFVVILVVSCVFIGSSISGIGKGIRFLSNVNSWLAIVLLLLALFVVGPANKMLMTFCDGLGNHIQYFASDSLGIDSFGDNSWVVNWRIFYWAWWIAWAPFVGMFIARISKGRTIREFIFAVMIVPSVLTFIWFAVFGTLSINVGQVFMGNDAESISTIAAAPNTAVFKIFEMCPMSNVMSVLVIVLLAIFFITSADSATFSLAMFSSEGDINPPAYRKIVWGVVEATMAFVLLCADSIKPLQIISIAAALPFLLIMLLICVSIVKSLRTET